VELKRVSKELLIKKKAQKGNREIIPAIKDHN